MSDEMDGHERRLHDLFHEVEAPASMRRWDAAGAPGAAAARHGGGFWTRPLRALFAPGGEPRLRPLAAALMVPLLALVIGGGLQLHAHFAGIGGGGEEPSPPARMDAAMAFDGAHGDVLLFGGRDAQGDVLGDTWSWDGSSWTQQHPAHSPSARAAAAMAYDPDHGQVVLYGGVAQGSLPRTTWTWDGSDWHEVTAGAGPLPAMLGGMAYDEAAHRLVLVAQKTGLIVNNSTTSQPAAETWIWTGSSWTSRSPHTAPVGLVVRPSLAYDSASRRLMLLTSLPGPACGVAPAMSAGDPAPQWVLAQPHSSPPGRTVPPVTMLPAPSPMALPPCSPPRSTSSAQGGATSCAGCPGGSQWFWNGSDWERNAHGGETVPFQGSNLVADPSSGHVVSLSSMATTSWTGMSWTETVNPQGLRGRVLPALAADPAHHVVVLFGGRSQGGMDGDTWTWDGHTWTHRAGPLPTAPTPAQVPPSAPANGGACAPNQAPPFSVEQTGDGSVAIIIDSPADTPHCSVLQGITVQLLDPAGAPLAVSGLPMTTGGRPPLTLVWSNWCGGRAGSIRIAAGQGSETDTMYAFPSCTDRSKPSTVHLTLSHGVTIP